MNYCDDNEAIKKWQSEEKCIWYWDPIQKKNRRYFPDFIIEYERKDGITIQEMVEIKPYRQVFGPPETPKRRTKAWAQQCMTYVVNQANWKAARKYCEDKGMNFRIIRKRTQINYKQRYLLHMIYHGITWPEVEYSLQFQAGEEIKYVPFSVKEEDPHPGIRITGYG